MDYNIHLSEDTLKKLEDAISGVEIIDLEVTEAGTYTAPEGKAYGKVVVTIESEEEVE